MKRIIMLTFSLLLLLITGFAPPVSAQTTGTNVYIDGLAVAFDVSPVIKDGRTLVPFRALAEAINVNVSWDNNSRTIQAASGPNLISLQIANKTAYKNSAAIELDVPPLIINGRTLVPLRFFTESFGCQVNWDNSNIKIISPVKSMTTVGYYALGDTKTSSWTNLFGKTFPNSDIGNTDVISELALGWFSLDQNGNLLTVSSTGWQRPEGWEQVLSTAQNYNLKTQMVVHMTDGDGSLTNLITNQTAVNKAVMDIAQATSNYQGVNLDFEGLGWQDKGEALTNTKNNFTNFVSLLATELRQNDKTLTLTLHAPNSAYQGYDYKALGKLVNNIIIMAYDYGPKPEPINQVKQAVEMALSNVPAEKLILGISIPSENSDSILTKVGIAKRYNLKGIALWRLGLVSNEEWATLRATLNAEK